MNNPSEVLEPHRHSWFDGLMKIGSRIEESRRKKDWSQSRLAEEIGIQQGRISRWERDDGMPTLPQIVAIAEATGATLDFLLLGKQSPIVEPTPEWVSLAMKLVIELGEKEAIRRLLQKPPAIELGGAEYTPETSDTILKRRSGA